MDNKIRRYSKIFEFIAADPIRSAVNALVQKPYDFTLNTEEGKKETYTIHPPTIGATGILADLYLRMDVDSGKFDEDPRGEAMRILKDPTKIDLICEFLATATFWKKADLLNREKIAKRAEYFKYVAFPSDFCDVVLYIIYSIDVRNFISSIALMENLKLGEIMPKNKPLKTVAIEK